MFISKRIKNFIDFMDQYLMVCNRLNTYVNKFKKNTSMYVTKVLGFFLHQVKYYYLDFACFPHIA